MFHLREPWTGDLHGGRGHVSLTPYVHPVSRPQILEAFQLECGGPKWDGCPRRHLHSQGRCVPGITGHPGREMGLSHKTGAQRPGCRAVPPGGVPRLSKPSRALLLNSHTYSRVTRCPSLPLLCELHMLTPYALTPRSRATTMGVLLKGNDSPPASSDASLWPKQVF